LTEIPSLTAAEFVHWLLLRRRRYRVSGASMIPLLNPGDEVLLDPRAYRRAAPQPGDMVVALHPAKTGIHIIRRVSALNPDGTVSLRGENPFESSDFRAVPTGTILGKVTSRF
jgi:nickel-type superoxide dismutase maturation protease